MNKPDIQYTLDMFSMTMFGLAVLVPVGLFFLLLNKITK